MLINNVELEDLDLLDADVADRYEKAINKLSESEVQTEELSLADTIRRECNLVFDFFNEVFGDGTDKKVFGTKVNYGICEAAFKEVIDYTSEQKKEIEKLASKYIPNRAARRTK